MSSQSKRTGLVGLIVLMSVALLGATVWQFNRLRSASAVAAFREVPEIPADADRLTTWMPDRQSGKKLDLPTRRAIEATYVRGWNAMNQFAQTRNSGPVEAWFVGPAKAGVLAIPPAEAAPVWSIGHRLEVRFVSSTETMISVRDHGSRVVREIGSPDGSMMISTNEQFDVVFTMEQGSWRIRHLRRVGGEENEIVLQNGGGFGVTPLPTPATEKLATVLRLNRVEVRFAEGAELEKQLKSLQVTLDRAEKKSERVVVSLFNARRNHLPIFWPSDDLFVTSAVTRFRNHPAVAMWNLKDKPEADDSISSPLQVRAWLAHVAGVVRGLDPVHPMTIAWESPSAASDPGLVDIVDVVSLHMGASSEDLSAVVAAAAGKPVGVIESDGSMKMLA
jgi:hypothetical protein